MKLRFLLIALSFFFTSCQSQKLEVDEPLAPYVQEFVLEAHERDVNIDSLLYKVNDMYIDNTMPLPVVGYYFKHDNSIAISSFLMMFGTKEQIRATIFHEIGHAFGLEHSCNTCNDIMSAKGTEKYNELTEEEWELLLDKFFEKIKKAT